MTNGNETAWQQCDTQVFWGEIAPCNHLVQIYEDDSVFLQTLEGFVSGGFTTGDSVIIIATTPHLNALEHRLRKKKFNIEALRESNQYIPLDAEKTLAKFMVEGWPDADLFKEVVTGLIHHARGDGRQIRAFGEMVAILWAQGHNGATVQLEHLWNSFCKTEAFCLFCAYPKSGFTQDALTSITDICCTHSRVIGGWNMPVNTLAYK